MMAIFSCVSVSSEILRTYVGFPVMLKPTDCPMPHNDYGGGGHDDVSNDPVNFFQHDIPLGVWISEVDVVEIY